MTKLRTFRIKHNYYQVMRVYHTQFYILYQLFKAAIRNSQTRYDLKCYYFKLELNYIFYFIIYNIFLILKIFLNIYNLIIRDLFIDKSIIKDKNIR